MINNNIPNLSQDKLLATRIKLLRQLRSGASWFYWIAGLSIINSIIYIFKGKLTFVVGLGFTQLIDGIAAGISEIADPTLMPMIRTIGLVLNIAIACGFVGFGVLGNKRKSWAIVTGMVLYGLDVIILIIATDWFSILFHLIGLFGLYTGLRACTQLSKLEVRNPLNPPGVVGGAF